MSTPKSPDPQRYDDREINAGAILKLAGVIAGTTLASVGAAALLASLFSSSTDSTYAPPPAIAASANAIPVGPRLQPSPAEGLRALRAEEDGILKTYGWVDQPKGVVRIPIDRAVELLAERGLPARAVAPPASTFSQPTNSTLITPPAKPKSAAGAEAEP